MFDAIAFRFFLLFLFVLLFSWPYLSFVGRVSIETLFAYLFAVWALLIGILILMGLARKHSDDIKNNG